MHPDIPRLAVEGDHERCDVRKRLPRSSDAVAPGDRALATSTRRRAGCLAGPLRKGKAVVDPRPDRLRLRYR
jgi:hypothetical protein